MPTFDLRIVAKDEASPFAPLFANGVTGQLERIAIFEAGTANGKTSIALLVTMPDGKIVAAEVTAAAYLTIAAALKGAMARFGEDPSGYA